MCGIFIIHVSSLALPCNGKIDIAFLLDSSGSIDTNSWQTLLRFTQNIVNRLEIGSDLIRVAGAKYGSTASVEFYLDSYTTRSAVSSRIGSFTYISGSTRITDGIRIAQNRIFQSSRGDRSDASNVLVIITDGKADDRDAAVIAANDFKNRVGTIIMVGVGPDFSYEELRMISTDPSEVLFDNNYQALLRQSFADDVARYACSLAQASGKFV